MVFPKLRLAAIAAVLVPCVPVAAVANTTTTVAGTVTNPALIASCSLVVDHDAATVTPVISLAPVALGAPTIVRFSFRTADGATVAMHDVRVPSASVMGARPALGTFPLPAVAERTSVRCDVTQQMAETIVDD